MTVVYGVSNSIQIIDDGYAGFFSTKEKAIDFINAHPAMFRDSYTSPHEPSDWIDEYELDAASIEIART